MHFGKYYNLKKLIKKAIKLNNKLYKQKLEQNPK